MSLNPTAFGDYIRSEMGFPEPVSVPLKAWAETIIDQLQVAAEVSFASGKITGIAPPSGGPLSAGGATGGVISGMTGSGLANVVAAFAGYPFPVSDPLLVICTAIVEHIQSEGEVVFDPGSITGTCTNSPSNPGTLSGGAGTGGYVVGLDGTLLALEAHSALQSLAPEYQVELPQEMKNFCIAIAGYITDNAEVTLSSVTGTCPSGGGSLSSGAASGGSIT